MKKIFKGLWLYGLSGSGKTFISKFLKKRIKNSVVVDGDTVRKYISFDLDYSKSSRTIQIKRMYGIGKIIIDSNKFPILSTVYFNKNLKEKCKNYNIIPIKVERLNFIKIKKNHKTYKNKKDVVGKDIFYSNFKTAIIKNDNSKQFIKNNKILKSLIDNN
tara:strand:- start:1094 stop:1573 length:480 start_codon:yes stop_codon:yes gene_type:complete